MADEDRAAADPLIAVLARYPFRFSFFQAVRLLQAGEPGCAPLGRLGPPQREAVRLRPNVSLGFPSADLENIGRHGARWRLTVNFLGLYGYATPLPTFYAQEMVAGNVEESNRRDFLDLFHHRLLSLHYRCWEKYRYYAQYKPVAADPLSQWLLGLAALDAGRCPDVSRPDRLLACLGLLLMRSRSATVITAVLSVYFDSISIRIDECVERWLAIEPPQQARLGRDNCRLAMDLTIGTRVLDRSGKFRIRLGPVGFETFQGFLPPGTQYTELRRLLGFLLRDQLAYDIELVLAEREIPDLCLGADSPCRLGWSSWLGHHRPCDGVAVLRGMG